MTRVGRAALVAVAAVLLPSSGAAAQAAGGRDRWLGADKVKHFLLAAFVNGVTHAALQTARVGPDGARLGGAGATVVFSVGKEVLDRRSGKPFSVRDLAWDAAGGLSSAALMRRVRE